MQWGSCCITCNIFVFTFRIPGCDVRYDFRIQRCSVRSLPPVVCRRADVCFRDYQCLGNSGDLHVLVI